MERNIFDAIGMLLIFIDIFIAFFALYKLLYSEKKKKYEKILFVNVVIVFVIVFAMSILQRLFY